MIERGWRLTSDLQSDATTNAHSYRVPHSLKGARSAGWGLMQGQHIVSDLQRGGGAFRGWRKLKGMHLIAGKGHRGGASEVPVCRWIAACAVQRPGSLLRLWKRPEALAVTLHRSRVEGCCRRPLQAARAPFSGWAPFQQAKAKGVAASCALHHARFASPPDRES